MVEALRVVVALAFWQRECGARLGAALACETRYMYSKFRSSPQYVQSFQPTLPCPRLRFSFSMPNTTKFISKIMQLTHMCTKPSSHQLMSSSRRQTPQRSPNPTQCLYSKSRISLPCPQKFRKHPHMYKIFATATYVLCSSAP